MMDVVLKRLNFRELVYAKVAFVLQAEQHFFAIIPRLSCFVKLNSVTSCFAIELCAYTDQAQLVTVG